jgi:hypothetical protein
MLDYEDYRVMTKGFSSANTAKRKPPKYEMFQCKSVPSRIPSYVKPDFSVCKCCSNTNFYVDVNHPEVVANTKGLHKRSVASLLKAKGFVGADSIKNLMKKEAEMFNQMFNL